MTMFKAFVIGLGLVLGLGAASAQTKKPHRKKPVQTPATGNKKQATDSTKDTQPPGATPPGATPPGATPPAATPPAAKSEATLPGAKGELSGTRDGVLSGPKDAGI